MGEAEVEERRERASVIKVMKGHCEKVKRKRSKGW
jgi:hypothetical protein